MTQVLKDIYKDKTLGPILGFKGGTAAFLFYDLPRFSVDLDFNLLDSTKEDPVLARIKKILAKYGNVEEAEKKRFTLFSLLSYEKGEHHLKVEISRRPETDNYEVRSWMGISMLVMDKERMFFHKLMALLDRKVFANRDLFDVWFFAKNNWPVKEISKDYLTKCIRVIEKIDNRYILQGLGELLDNSQKVWAKSHLRDEAIFQLKLLSDNSRSNP